MASFFKSLFFGESEETEEEKSARNFDVLKYDGIKALKIGKTAYAVRCFEEALKLQEDAEVLEHLVSAYSREERMEDAVAAAGRLVDMAPDNVAVRLMRANLNFMREDYPAAVADCEEAGRLDGKNPLPYYTLGKVRKAAGDTVGAIVGLSKAISLKGDFAEARLLRAELMLDAGDFKDGLEDAEEVVRLLPEEENAYLVRGRLQTALGEVGKAEKDYRFVTELNPFNERAYLALGELYMQKGEPGEAVSLLDEAIELKPEFAKAYKERGRARLMQGDRTGSLEDMKKAMELDSEGDEARKINGTYSNFEDMYQNRPL